MTCTQCNTQVSASLIICPNCFADLRSMPGSEHLQQPSPKSEQTTAAEPLSRSYEPEPEPQQAVQRQPLPPAEKHVPHPPTYTQNNESQIRIPRTPVGLIIAAFVLWLFCLVAVVGVLFRLSESMLLSFGDYIWCFVWGIPAFIITMNAKKKISIINEMRDNYERKRRGR